MECSERQTLRERNTHYVSLFATTNAPRADQRLCGQSTCGLHLGTRLGDVGGAVLRQTNFVLVAHLANSFEQDTLGDVTDLRATQTVGTQTIVQIGQIAYGAQHYGLIGVDDLDRILHRVGCRLTLGLDLELQRLAEHFATLLCGDQTLINTRLNLGQFATTYDRHLATRCAYHTQSHALALGNSLDVSGYGAPLDQFCTREGLLLGAWGEFDVECLLGATGLRNGNYRYGVLALFEHHLGSPTARRIDCELLAIDRECCVEIGNTRDRVACGLGCGALATTDFKTLSRCGHYGHCNGAHKHKDSFHCDMFFSLFALHSTNISIKKGTIARIVPFF